mmetsp:Transcript_31453/g.45885  ORF Transcript_31453/g.45885 Transcript_31453/m.45885 type:complete len:99 (+) Transcript_31453:37-333(+)
MAKVKGSALQDSSTIAPKCSKFVQPLRKRTVNTEQIGNRHYNVLLDFVRCQRKVNKTCSGEDKSYSLCHASVMGTGSYEGRKHCGEEFKEFFDCVMRK